MSSVEYYDSLISQIESVPDCNALSVLTAEIEVIFTEALASLTESIDELALLITVPGADLGEIVEWITAVINTYLGPYNKMLLLQIETITKQAEALAAINAKIAELGCVI